LILVLAYQVLVWSLPYYTRGAYGDEALYIDVGHRIIEHLLHGNPIGDRPGDYFSGTPWFFPVFAALAHSALGMTGARLLGLAAILVCTVAVFGVTRSLLGSEVAPFAAFAFGSCGSVIYLSRLAVFDAWGLAFVALASWLAVESARRRALSWTAVVGIASLLALAVLTKYAFVVYVPVVVLLPVAVSWNASRWRVVLKAFVSAVLAGALLASAFLMWGSDNWPGLWKTTLSRHLGPTTHRLTLALDLLRWVGPLLALAVLGGLLLWRKRPALVLVLWFGSGVAAVEQIRMGEHVAFPKHVGLGILFAAPLVGYAFARCLATGRKWARPVAILGAAVLLGHGLYYSHLFLNSWPDNTQLAKVLSQALQLNPTKPVIGEESYTIRYLFRTSHPQTPVLSISALSNPRSAFTSHQFGTVFVLGHAHAAKTFIVIAGTPHSRYALYARVDRIVNGVRTDKWDVYVLEPVRRPQP
jgi:4-amino-4-deoxy-L-arabinose transferase-like glycosyltransferase